ncbi:hypothetical protein U6U55_12200, partial [Cutibacterium acnes]
MPFTKNRKNKSTTRNRLSIRFPKIGNANAARARTSTSLALVYQLASKAKSISTKTPALKKANSL